MRRGRKGMLDEVDCRRELTGSAYALDARGYNVQMDQPT